MNDHAVRRRRASNPRSVHTRMFCLVLGAAIAVLPGCAFDGTSLDAESEDLEPVETLSQATEADCDKNGAIGVFRAIGWPSSFDSKGRRIELQNESLVDMYSRAEIKTGFRQGDHVWIDRSIRIMSSLKPQQFRDDNRVRSQGGGWKQCGPFSVFRTQSVYSWHRAVRACWRPPGGPSECGAWNIDQ